MNGPTKRTYVLQKLIKNNYMSLIFNSEVITLGYYSLANKHESHRFLQMIIMVLIPYNMVSIIHA